MAGTEEEVVGAEDLLLVRDVLVLGMMLLLLVVLEPFAWYNESPFDPPHICVLSAAQGMLHRPSDTGAEPATSVLPQ